MVLMCCKTLEYQSIQLTSVLRAARSRYILTRSVLVPVLRLGHLRHSDLGMIAESGEEAGRGEGRSLHDVERWQTAQTPASLRPRATGEATTHTLHQQPVNDIDYKLRENLTQEAKLSLG